MELYRHPFNMTCKIQYDDSYSCHKISRIEMCPFSRRFNIKPKTKAVSPLNLPNSSNTEKVLENPNFQEPIQPHLLQYYKIESLHEQK